MSIANKISEKEKELQELEKERLHKIEMNTKTDGGYSARRQINDTYYARMNAVKAEIRALKEAQKAGLAEKEASDYASSEARRSGEERERSLRREASIMTNSVADLFYYLGKVADRLCYIEAAAGTSGNISVRAENFPIDSFPEAGLRNKSFHKSEREFPELYQQRFIITGSGKNFRYIRERPHECLALIEVVKGGYNILWGLTS